eukprot:jgi/Mesen1/8697/ME000052S08131
MRPSADAAAISAFPYSIGREASGLQNAAHQVGIGGQALQDSLSTAQVLGSAMEQAKVAETRNAMLYDSNGRGLEEATLNARHLLQLVATSLGDGMNINEYPYTDTSSEGVIGKSTTTAHINRPVSGGTLFFDEDDVFEIHLCAEASQHMIEKQASMIGIYDKINDMDNLDPVETEKLRLQREALRREIDFLMNHMGLSPSSIERPHISHSGLGIGPSPSVPSPPLLHGRSLLGQTLMLDASSPGQRNWSNSGGRQAGVHEHYPPPYRDPDSPIFGYDREYSCVERPTGPRKFITIDYADGTIMKQWAKTSFPWFQELKGNNVKYFGNTSFRPNQLEIMNATLSKRDVFVLMPTGGGKSLTYQLPALYDAGVTLVVSPLVSLIVDQIMHLEQANIPAAQMTASQEWPEVQRILAELNSPTCSLKFLYVTPEKVARSDTLVRQLEGMHRNGRLARFVIDEAHCISQWGHDFRPDYQSLGILKSKFPNVPLMALTATATASVREDVVQALGMRDCIVFKQTFNRPNLRYEVRPKTKKCLEDIDRYIRGKGWQGESGIVYCLSRHDCERTAEKLRELGHRAAYYHGNMDPNERTQVQRRWSTDVVNIMCATVAFGMGINKPDVRFVIHHALPKSVEGYHQESGRAGRDSQDAACLLFYSYSDSLRVKSMLVSGASDQQQQQHNSRNQLSTKAAAQLESNMENLRRVVAYCENDVDCRRSLLLSHFGEKFEASQCNGTCGNCSRGYASVEKDLSEPAKQLVELIAAMGQRQSLQYVQDVYRGSSNVQVRKKGHMALALHGVGKALSKGDVERILHHMVAENILVEDVCKSDVYGSVSSVVKINEQRARALVAGKLAVLIRFPVAKVSGVAAAPPLRQVALELERGGARSVVAPKTNSSFGTQDDRASTTVRQFDKELGEKVMAELKVLRANIVQKMGKDTQPYHVFRNGILQEISKLLPQTVEDLLKVQGLGKVKVNKYGAEVVDVVSRVVSEHRGNFSTSAPSLTKTSVVISRSHFDPYKFQLPPAKRLCLEDDGEGWRSTRM